MQNPPCDKELARNNMRLDHLGVDVLSVDHLINFPYTCQLPQLDTVRTNFKLLVCHHSLVVGMVSWRSTCREALELYSRQVALTVTFPTTRTILRSPVVGYLRLPASRAPSFPFKLPPKCFHSLPSLPWLLPPRTSSRTHSGQSRPMGSGWKLTRLLNNLNLPHLLRSVNPCWPPSGGTG